MRMRMRMKKDGVMSSNPEGLYVYRRSILGWFLTPSGVTCQSAQGERNPELYANNKEGMINIHPSFSR